MHIPRETTEPYWVFDKARAAHIGRSILYTAAKRSPAHKEHTARVISARPPNKMAGATRAIMVTQL